MCCRGSEASPSGGPGAQPRHAFGSFRRETKGTPGVGRVGPLMGRSEEPSLTTCSRRGCAPPRIGGCWGSRPLQKPPRGAAVPLYLYPEKPQKLHPTVQPNRKKNKKNRRPSLPVWGRASLHVASDDTSACSVKRNMRSGKNNCPAALENCWKICYNY